MRFMMNEKSNVEAALTFVKALHEFHTEEAPNDKVTAEVIRRTGEGVTALEFLLRALEAKRVSS